MGQGYRERRRLPIFNVSTLKYGDTVGDWTEPTEQEREEMEAAEKAARAQRERLAAERRVAMRMVLHAQVNLKSESNFFMGFTENISEGGIFVSTLSPPDMGEKVELSVGVEGSEQMTIKGTVRWHRTGDDGNPTGCGVQFDEIDDDTRRAIEMLLVTLEKEPLFHDLD
jgi:uncharacterized protein (TIGR02266 family)